MSDHRLKFDQEIVTCRECGKVMTADAWATESCPGRRDRETEVDERGLTYLDRMMFDDPRA